MRERKGEREKESMSWFENFTSNFRPSCGFLKACPVGFIDYTYIDRKTRLSVTPGHHTVLEGLREGVM